MPSKQLRKFGLIGKELHYSFSKGFFETRFKVENPFLSYENIELSTANEVKDWLETHRTDFEGVNVTIPYKSVVIPFLDEVDEVAQAIGAVNTIKFQDGLMKGYNTDTYGFQQSIKPFFRNIHERALILGTGGASKAVAYSLRKLGVSVAFLSRTPNPEQQIFGYEQANETMVKTFQFIVNCTPIGTYPNIDEAPNFPIHFVGEDHLVVDLIYNPEETRFLKIAREHGADTLNGLSMLKHQAIQAWKIWNNS